MKYNLLIADDEAVEREALSDLAHELFTDKFEIALAENGKNAVDICAEFKPDIALMDIKMPRMNGIDAAKLILQSHPNCKIIMLTGFTYFNYAKDSVSLGAMDFLVKPASDETVEKALQAAMSAVDADRAANSRHTEAPQENSGSSHKQESELVSEIVFSGLDKQTLCRMVSEIYPEVRYGVAVVINLNSDKSAGISPSIPSSELHNCCMEAAKRCGADALNILFCRRLDKLYLTLLSEKAYDKEFYERFAQSFIEVMAEHDIAARIKFSGLSQDISHLPMGFIEAQNVRIKANEKIGWFSAEMLRSNQDNDGASQENQLCDWLDQKQFDDAVLLFEHMVNSIIDEGRDVSIKIYELIVVLNRHARQKIEISPCHPLWNKLLAIEDDAARKQFAHHYLQKVIDLLIMDDAADNEAWPQEILEFINAEYQNNITLEDASRKVGFSTYYFSRLFKQKFDKPFIEYLTQLRIQKAKTLLSSPGVSVKNVCYSVGYSDPNYFARVFKRETGMSPSKFQKKALRIED